MTKTPWSIRIISMLAGLLWIAAYLLMGMGDVGMSVWQEVAVATVPAVAIVAAVSSGLELRLERQESR